AAGAVYKGLALGTNASGSLLFAANFNAGTVDVYDKNFKKVNLPFTDATLPAGFAPFGIANIGGSIYVSYAKQNADKHDDVAGPGTGFTRLSATNATPRPRLPPAAPLNPPGPPVRAPANFGAFSNDLLVGNFGNGLINAFDPTTGAFLGQLQDFNG